MLKILDNSSSIDLQIAAVTCIDHVAMKFGGKDHDTIFTAARIIAASAILKSKEDRLKTASMLCLSSLVYIIEEKFIPLLTPVLPIVFAHLDYCVTEESSDNEMHDAALGLLCQIARCIPNVLSESDLNTILRLLLASSNSKSSESAKSIRLSMHMAILEGFDPRLTFAAIENSSREAIIAGFVVSLLGDSLVELNG